MSDHESKPKPRKATKPQRVEVQDKRGNIARPYEQDIDAWLANGWTRVNSGKASD